MECKSSLTVCVSYFIKSPLSSKTLTMFIVSSTFNSKHFQTNVWIDHDRNAWLKSGRLLVSRKTKPFPPNFFMKWIVTNAFNMSLPALRSSCNNKWFLLKLPFQPVYCTTNFMLCLSTDIIWGRTLFEPGRTVFSLTEFLPAAPLLVDVWHRHATAFSLYDHQKFIFCWQYY